MLLYTNTNKKPSCRQGGPTISEVQRPTFGRRKIAISQSDCNPAHAMVTLLYRTLQTTLRYDMAIWRTRGDRCRQKQCVEDCGQTAADRDMVTIIDSLQKLVIAVSSVQRYHRRPPTTYRSATIPHVCHSRAQNDSSRLSKVVLTKTAYATSYQ